MKSQMGCFVLFISVFYIAGFGVLGYGAWSAWRSTQAAGWPTARGVLTKIDLHENSSGDGGPTYEVKVEYTYSVAGTPYRGSRLAFGYAGSSGREGHGEIYEKLKAAKSVDVRYDPADPAASALSFGIHRSIQFTLAFGITWLAFVFGFTVIWWLASLNDTVLLQHLTVQ